jgi:hypothetical protein
MGLRAGLHDPRTTASQLIVALRARKRWEWAFHESLLATFSIT